MAVRAKNAEIRTITGNLSGNATSATTATNDTKGQAITSYIRALSISGRTITYTKGDGTTGTITTQDTNSTYSLATQSADGLMSAADKTKLDKYAYSHTYTREATLATKGYVKININSAGWMLSFTLRIYQGYRAIDLQISGYDYDDRYWYRPQAKIISDTNNASMNVKFGYDDINKLWIAIPTDIYYSMTIFDVNNGYVQISDYNDLFTFTFMTTLTGTVQSTVTAHSPWYRNETVSVAAKLETARTIALTGSVTGSGTFDGSGNLSINTTTNHTHNYLPLAGGTMTGNISYKGASGTVHAMIQFKSGNENGDGIVIGGGGLTVIGAGESASVVAAQYTGTTESMYISADDGIVFYSNVDGGWNSRKTASFGANGVFTAPSFSGALDGNATSADKATKDSADQTITSTYIKALSISGRTITYTKGDGTTGTITTQDTNTTYTLAGLVGSTAIGSTTQPIYWDGSKFTTIGYAIAKSVPSNAVFTDTHYTTGLKVGASATATANAAASNGSVYLNALDNTTVRDSHLIKGSGATTVTSDANGVITISSTDTNTNTTYSAGTGLSLSGTTFNHKNSVTAATAQGDASKTLTFGGTFTIPTVTYDAQGHITAKGTTTMTMPANPNTDTHYTTHLYAGTSSGVANAATTNGNTYLIIADNSTARNRVKIAGSGATTVTSDANGNITISSTDTNTTYPIYSKYFTTGYKTAYRTQTKGSSANGDYISTIRCNDSVEDAPRYGSGLAWGSSDTNGYLTINYSSPQVLIGGGNADKLNWVKAISLDGHTHNYAGSSSAGGSATSAVKLDGFNNGSLSFWETVNTTAKTGTIVKRMTTSDGSEIIFSARGGQLDVIIDGNFYQNEGKYLVLDSSNYKSYCTPANIGAATTAVATTSANGLMSAADKKKLDGITSGANAYTHPSHTAYSSGLYKVTVNALGHVTAATAVTKADITALGIPGSDTNTWRGVQDNLTSTATDQSLSANQGRVLKGLVDGKAAASHTHPYLSSAPAFIELNSTGGLSGYGGFIDFHFNGSTADYTSRIIESASGTLLINSVTIKGSTITGSLSGNATTATKATQDSAGQQINTTYIKALSVSGKTITYTKGDGTTGTITTQDTNTWRGIQNNLTSDSTTDSLSAAQGKVLKGLVDGKAAASHSHTTVVGSYTGNGGQQNPKYFGVNKVGFLMMNTTINGDAHYKDFIIMDNYAGNDVGGATALGIDRQEMKAFIMGSDAERTSWSRSAELLTTSNYTSYTVKKDGTGASGTWGINVTGSAGSVAWGNVTGKPSTYTPASHTHNYAGSSSAGGDATNALKLGGLSASTSATKSTIVARDSNNYVFFNYINSNTSNSENPTISQIIVTNGSDSYYRKASLAHLKSSLGSMPASDVYAWAKASTKPTYTASEVGAAAASHTHSGYAASNHTHSGYVATSGGAMTGALKVNCSNVGTDYTTYRFRNIGFGTTSTPTSDSTYGGNGAIYFMYS